MKPLKSIFLVYILVIPKFIYSQNNIDKSLVREVDTLKTRNSTHIENYKSIENGAISKINNLDFNQSICKNTSLQLVRNKLTGLSISIPYGSNPTNTEVEFGIRGINTLFGENNIIYIIDGIPGNIESVAPHDIKSISLLRDFSTTSLFGFLSNGKIILIETESSMSKPSKLNVNYSTQYSFENISKSAEVLTAEEFRNQSRYDFGYNTNWLDEITQNKISQQHYLSLNGGTKNTNVYGSINYRNYEGIIKKSGKKNILSYLMIKSNALNNKLTLDISGRLNNTINNLINDELLEQTIKFNPTERIYNDDGSYTNMDLYNYYNPVSLLNESELKNIQNEIHLQNKIGYSISDNWYLHSNLAYTSNMIKISEYSNDRYLPNQIHGIKYVDKNNKINSSQTYFDIYANFTKLFSNQSIDLTLGYQLLKNTQSFNNKFSYYYLDEIFGDTTQSKKNYDKQGVFGSTNYSIWNKYIATISFYYYQNEENKNPFDPSILFTWLISREEFMKNIKQINELKIRASFGKKTLLSPQNIEYNYLDDIKNEKINEVNFGAEWSLFENKLMGSIDYYIRKTSNLHYLVSLPAPPYIYTSAVDNVGFIENKGFEIGLQLLLIKSKRLTWKLLANYSTNKNLISITNDKFWIINDYGSIATPISTTIYRIEDNQPLGNFFGFKSIGIEDNGFWIIESEDGNPTSYFNEKNKQLLGNSIPKHNIGISNSVKFKKFDICINLRGVYDFQILNNQRMYYENSNNTHNKLISSNELFLDKEILVSKKYVSYYIENGDYLKVDDITLGYETQLNKIHTSIRVYLSIQNAYTFTKYKGIDPELSISYGYSGFEKVNAHPYLTTYSLGANFKF